VLSLYRSIPLSLLTVDSNSKPKVDHTILLDEREKFIPLDMSKPFKLNAGTVSVCTLSLVSLDLHHAEFAVVFRSPYFVHIGAFGSDRKGGSKGKLRILL
jgi:hypothetical protein